MRKTRYFPYGRLSGALMALFAAIILLAAPVRAEEAWEEWTAFEETSQMSVDHGPWAKLLKKYVKSRKKGPNLVDYAGLKANEADKAALDAYVAALEGVTVSELNRDEQYSYWANLYNALTVKVVTEHYPVKSIKDIGISPGFFSSGPWKAKLLTIEGRKVSLDDIEHRILRPIWKDPRTHYVLNCASIGCPDLPVKPLDPAKLDAQLDAAAKAYIGAERGARFEEGRLILSSIYDWYGSDFGGKPAAIIAHLKEFAPAALKAKLEETRRIYDYEYDWSLNEWRGDEDEKGANE